MVHVVLSDEVVTCRFTCSFDTANQVELDAWNTTVVFEGISDGVPLTAYLN
jgi:hypothetical protein